MNTLQYYITEQWQHTKVWEIVAVLFAVLQVLLAYHNKVLTYPAGIISTAIFTWLFGLKAGLYADASLNLYYFLMSIYGWIVWSRKKGQASVRVTACNSRERNTAIAIVAGAFLLLYLILRHLTDSVVPVWDALVSAFAWSGMWLMARRKIENWILLNISNALAIPLLFYKHLPLTALLTVFLFIVATLAYFRWKKLLHLPDNSGQKHAGAAI